ncbi:hypothetical protein [Endozoicomonas sp. Mp262]|uniref:portal protein n=1 Tax=Endozoicomonas sp. Mp262 TaxID=2919499 RepID=UPI0021D8096A
MNGHGLVQLATPEQVAAMQEQADAQQRQEESARDAYASDLQSRWQGYREARREAEQEWLDSLSAIKGEYNAEQKRIMAENDSLSDVYIKLTATKVNTAYSRLIDILFQNVDSFWDVVAAPIAELPKAIRAHIRNQAIQELLPYPLAPDIRSQLIDERVDELQGELLTKAMNAADDAARKMKRQIKDYLVNADGLSQIKQTAREMVSLGTGCLKVATLNVRLHEKWESEGDQWVLNEQQQIEPDINFTSVFNAFPDPYSDDCGRPNDLFIRHVLTRHQLRELGSTPGFDGDMVETIVHEAPQGNHTPLDYERELRQINDSDETFVTPRRYDVLEYWGPVDGGQLTIYGIQDVVDNQEYQANIWVCNGRVIMARLNPLKPEEIPYKFIPYEKVLHRFWGIGIPAMMNDAQDVMNATGRALLDNAALTSGPMFQMDVHKLPEGVSLEEAKKIHPRKLWLYDGSQSDGPMINAINVQSNQSELMGIFELFRRFADEETSLPSYTHGEQTQSLNKTASGMSMLMTAANVSLKSVVKNIDDYGIRPLIESLYHFAMRWSDLEDGKRGDLDVIPMGSSALVAKELQSQRMMQAMQATANPVYGPMTEHRYLLSEYFKSLDIDNEKALVPEEKLYADPLNPAGGGGADQPVQQQGVPGSAGAPEAPAAGSGEPPVEQRGTIGNTPHPRPYQGAR